MSEEEQLIYKYMRQRIKPARDEATELYRKHRHLVKHKMHLFGVAIELSARELMELILEDVDASEYVNNSGHWKFCWYKGRGKELELLVNHDSFKPMYAHIRLHIEAKSNLDHKLLKSMYNFSQKLRDFYALDFLEDIPKFLDKKNQPEEVGFLFD